MIRSPLKTSICALHREVNEVGLNTFQIRFNKSMFSGWGVLKLKQHLSLFIAVFK